MFIFCHTKFAVIARCPRTQETETGWFSQIKGQLGLLSKVLCSKIDKLTSVAALLGLKSKWAPSLSVMLTHFSFLPAELHPPEHQRNRKPRQECPPVNLYLHSQGEPAGFALLTLSRCLRGPNWFIFQRPDRAAVHSLPCHYRINVTVLRFLCFC